MGKNPPVYTFRRPKKAQIPPIPIKDSGKEFYTVMDDSDDGRGYRYHKYSFFLILMIFALLILSMCYIYLYGLPITAH